MTFVDRPFVQSAAVVDRAVRPRINYVVFSSI